MEVQIIIKMPSYLIDEWSRQHRLLSRAFGIKTIRSFNSTMHSICKDILFVELDKQIAQQNTSINVLPMMQKLAMSLATVIALGGTKEISERVTSLMFFLIG
jgi:cytochrome P450